MAKAKKKKASAYEKPVKKQGTFSDVIKVAMTEPPSKPVKPKEKAVKKKK
jgi:hypothetical protein